MKQCRLCEQKIYKNDNPTDSLCSSYHISLCQKDVDKCEKCKKLTNNILKLFTKRKSRK